MRVRPSAFALDRRDVNRLPALGANDDLARVDHAVWLPRAVASFGAARLGSHLYVYGGHVGRTHRHSTENLSDVFARYDVVNGGTIIAEQAALDQLSARVGQSAASDNNGGES